MARSRQVSAIAMCLCLLLASCGSILPSVVSTDHEYVLVRAQGDGLIVVEDDDPLYARFDAEVLGDPYLARLHSVFENTTESFLATYMPTSVPQTISNHMIIVVDSTSAGVLHDIKVKAGNEQVSIELALGLGRGGSIDLAFACQSMPNAMGQMLLELAGLKPDRKGPPQVPALYEVTTPAAAFRIGFSAALDATYGQQHAELLRQLHQENPSAEAQERLLRYEAIPHNGLRFRFEGSRPTAELRSREEAARTPGVVAAFIYRLIEQADSFYPQRYLLWFNSYGPDELAYGKVLLAVNRLPRHRAVSVDAFIDSYTEVFTSEKDVVLELAKRILG